MSDRLPDAPVTDQRRELVAPFFELGPKNLLRLPEIISVATAAAQAGARFDVSILLTVPTALIAPVRAEVPGVYVFAQGMDGDALGATVGRVSAEALVDAGADGVMLNHSASRLATGDSLVHLIERAHRNGLRTMVCADTEDEVVGLLPLQPSIILFEPPELIGGTHRAARPWIASTNERARAMSTDTLLMHAGGVAAPEDARAILAGGADGTGSTSAVLLSDDPPAAAFLYIEAVRRGFDEYAHNTQEGAK